MAPFFGVGAEKAEIVEAKDIIRRLKDAANQAKRLIKIERAEIRTERKGWLTNLKAKEEIIEEEEVIALLRDLILAFRDLIALLYAQVREEKAEGRSQAFKKFKGALEKELNVLIAEIRKLEGLEARL